MVVSGNYTDDAYNTDISFSGVVGIRATSGASAFSGTGTLLWDGRAVLTAAHVVSGRTGDVEVTFNTPAGQKVVRTSDWVIHPNYDSINVNQDLAIVWLNSPAPNDASRYQLHRQSNEIFQDFTMVGFGKLGIGSTGATVVNTSNVRLTAKNTFDITGEDLDGIKGFKFSWSPVNILFADFDSGSSQNDVFGRLINLNNLGLGLSEGFIASGDSGGPAFVEGQLAGVASYVSTLSQPFIYPDYDKIENNSTFGEVAAWQRVSSYQQWIDQSLREHFPNSPTAANEVKTAVSEGSSGTTTAYFMVEFSGLREAGDIVSVDFTTRDGSAKAGEDYLAVSGQLNIYDDEDYALIPVEILGDRVAEKNETFYLAITNPVGGDFANDAIELIAMRTIVNDDGILVT